MIVLSGHFYLQAGGGVLLCLEPLSPEMLTACGAWLMAEAAEYPATSNAPLLSGLQLCL